MVNGASAYNYNPYPAFYRAASGAVVLNKNEIQNMVKFVNGQPITSMDTPGVVESAVATLPFAGIIGGFQGIAAVKNNGLSGTELDAYKAAKKAGIAPKMSWLEKYRETAKNIKKEYTYTRGDAFKAGKDFFNKEYGDFYKKVTTPNEARLPFGIGKMMDKIPGYTKLRATGFGKAMGRSGSGFMLVMDGTIKTFTDVVPAFKQLGFKSGMKQIAKSGTEVAIGSIGWLAGDALGMSIGAAIGTAICPGVGTAIGGFLGRFIGGAMGGAVAAKAAKAITGKSELEKAQDENNAKLASQIEADDKTKLELAAQTLKQAEETLKQDPENKDALIAKATAEKVIVQAQAQVQEQQIQQEAQQPSQTANGYQQSFKGLNGIPTVPGFNGYSYDMNQFRSAMTQASSAMNARAVNPFMQQQYQVR